MEDYKRSGTTASRLREAMVACGKKQSVLADETGLPRSAVSRYLKGEIEPKSGSVSKLAVALNVSEMWLWGYDVPRERTVSQQKNDLLAELVVQMRGNNELFGLVAKIAALDDEQRELVDRLVSSIAK